MPSFDTDIRNFDETNVDVIGKDWTDEDVFRTWSKHTLIIQRQTEYWREYLERGRTCMDFYRGEIFDDETRETLENVEDKYVVEPVKIKPAINALVGELMGRRRSGRITVEGSTLSVPESRSNEILTVNMVLKHMQRRWDEKRLLGDVLRDGMVACYPVWIWFQQTAMSDIPELGPYHPVVLPWESTFASPFNFRSAVGKDVTALTRHQKMSTEDIIDMWPEQEDMIYRWLEETKSRMRSDTLNFDHMDNWEIAFGSEMRDLVLFTAMTGINTLMAPDGYWNVYERSYQVRREEIVAIDLFNTENIIVRPPTFEEAEWREFLQAEQSNRNTQFVEAVRPVKILWTTVLSDTGHVFSNGPCWFQAHGRLPGVPIVPSMIDSVPAGPAMDMLSDALAIAVAETEYLDDLRKNSGSVTIAREGTVSNADQFDSEMNKAHGFLSVRAEAPPFNNCIMEWKRTPNPNYQEYSIKRENDMRRAVMINENLMGQTVADQSGRAKDIEITRALITQSIYVDNWNSFVEAFQNLKLRVMPMVYDHYDVLDIEDEETGNNLIQPVNVPTTAPGGETVKIANDLTSHKYRWVMTVVDDSPTAKEEEYKQAIIFLNAVPGPVINADPSGKLLARFMLAMPNRFLNEAGQALAQDADMRMQSMSESQNRKDLAELQKQLAEMKIDAERARRQGVNLTITGEQLAQFPQLAQYLEQFFGQQQQQQPGPPQAAPTTQPPSPAQTPVPA